MVLLCLLKIILLSFRCQSSNFSDLPQELVHSRVYGLLGSRDAIKCLSTLSNGTYHQYFSSNHQKQLRSIKLLRLYIQEKCTQLSTIGIAFIRIVGNRVHLNEMYALKLPKMLEEIQQIHAGNEARCIMHALNVQVMTVMDLCALPDTMDYKLKLLILSSRSLAPMVTAKPFQTMRGIAISMNYAMEIAWRSFPWKPVGLKFKMDIFYFGHLYKYLFDHHHKELGIPKLDMIFNDDDDDDSKEKKQLHELINRFGFIPWHRDTMHEWSNQTLSLIDNESISVKWGEIKKMNDVLSRICAYSLQKRDVMDIKVFFVEFLSDLIFLFS